MLSVEPKSSHKLDVNSRPKSWNSITSTVNKFVPKIKKSKSVIEKRVNNCFLNNESSNGSQNDPLENHRTSNALCKSSELLRYVTIELLSPNSLKGKKEIPSEMSKSIYLITPQLKLTAYSDEPRVEHECSKLPLPSNKTFGRLRAFSENSSYFTHRKENYANNEHTLTNRKHSLIEDVSILTEDANNRPHSPKYNASEKLSKHDVEIDSFLNIVRIENQDKESSTVDNTFFGNLISKVIEQNTENMTYDANLSITRSRKISQELERHIKNYFNVEETLYRIIVQVFVGELKDHGMGLAMRCDTEHFASSTVRRNNMFVSAIVALSR